jgi:hypothetical protein
MPVALPGERVVQFLVGHGGMPMGLVSGELHDQDSSLGDLFVALSGHVDLLLRLSGNQPESVSPVPSLSIPFHRTHV